MYVGMYYYERHYICIYFDNLLCQTMYMLKFWIILCDFMAVCTFYITRAILLHRRANRIYCRLYGMLAHGWHVAGTTCAFDVHQVEKLYFYSQTNLCFYCIFIVLLVSVQLVFSSGQCCSHVQCLNVCQQLCF